MASEVRSLDVIGRLGLTPRHGRDTVSKMNAVEFTIELSGTGVLKIPSEAAAQLPKSGMARVIVLTQEDSEDIEWRRGAYQQFLRDDPPEDAIYDSSR